MKRSYLPILYLLMVVEFVCLLPLYVRTGWRALSKRWARG